MFCITRSQRGRSAEAFELIASPAKIRGAIAFVDTHPQEFQVYLEEQERRDEEFAQADCSYGVDGVAADSVGESGKVAASTVSVMTKL
jgi:hypothetical protein